MTTGSNCGPNRTCHFACDCREAAHAEEVRRLREALENISEETTDYTARTIAEDALKEVSRV